MRRMSTAVLVVAAVAVSLALAGCGGSSSSSKPSSSKAPATQNTDPSVTAKPAGATPSESATMVCGSEAQTDVGESLGVRATRLTTPTWIDHVYSCTWVYPNGSFRLSVKELSNLAETKSYFAQLGTKLGEKPGGSIALGQGAFTTTDGSVVVRKDFKVLDVDIAKLPATFGQPPQSRADVALSIAAVLMSCWTGA